MLRFSIPSAAALGTAATLTAFAASCSSGVATGNNATFPATPLQVMACDPSTLRVELRTAPAQPPTAGLDGVEVVLTDPATGHPIDDAKITLVPWMPLMGHGADLTPVFSAKGKGRYVSTNVNLYMPGEWQLRFQFRSSSKGDCSATPAFDVP